MRKIARKLVIGVLIVLHALIVVAPTQAQSGCAFQSPMTDGRSVMDHIVAGGDLDKKFVGLHQASPEHWPGGDTQGEVRPIFRDGGTVRFAGWDPAGAGWGVVIDGEGGCRGWVMAVWHMPEDPSSRLHGAGSFVDGSTILGSHGHSGDMSPEVWAHNHISVGFNQPISFNDGTIVKEVGGYWWIHAARVEGGSLSSAIGSGLEMKLVALGVALLLLVGMCFRGDSRMVAAGSRTLSSALWALIFGMRQSTRKAQGFGSAWGLVFVLLWSLTIFVLGQSGIKISLETSGWTTGTCEVSTTFPEKVRHWCDQITSSAHANGLDPNLVAAVVTVESGGDPLAFSPDGAVGLMQMMPRDGIAATFNCPNGPCFEDRPTIGELQNPEFNLSYSTEFLAGKIAQTGSIRNGLRAYGPAGLDFGYADTVLGIYDQNK